MAKVLPYEILINLGQIGEVEKRHTNVICVSSLGLDLLFVQLSKENLFLQLSQLCSSYFCSIAKSCSTLCNSMDTVAHQTSLSFTVSWCLIKFIFTELMMNIILAISSSATLFSFCLQSIPVSVSSDFTYYLCFDHGDVCVCGLVFSEVMTTSPS